MACARHKEAAVAEDYTCRSADVSDIPALVKHRRLITVELAEGEGQTLRASALEVMDKAYAAYLREHLFEGTAWAWIAERGGTAVASGVVSQLLWPPSAWQTTQKVGLLHSMYTAPGHRRRGLAKMILEAAISRCKQSGFKWMTLGAREETRGLYESVGFRPNPATIMNLGL